MRKRLLALAGAGAITVMAAAAPAIASTHAPARDGVNLEVCLQANNALCLDGPPGSMTQLTIDNGAQYWEADWGTVSSQFDSSSLNSAFSGNGVIRLYDSSALNRCIRVNSATYGQPMLGTPGAACDFVETSSGKLVSIGATNDAGGNTAYYLQTNSANFGNSVYLDVLDTGSYRAWLYQHF